MIVKNILSGNKAPVGFFRKKQNRKDLIIYFVEIILKKIPTDVPSVNEFKTHNLYSFLIKYYGGSPVKAILEAYEELNIKQLLDDPDFILDNIFYNKKTPPKNFWKEEENRKLTVFKLVSVLNIEPQKIKVNDFKKLNLMGFLVHYYQGSPSKALEFML